AGGPGTRGRRWRFRGWSPCSAGRRGLRPPFPGAGCSWRGVAARLVALAVLVVPAEVGLAAHARAGGDGERAGLDVADQHAALLQLDQRGALDVAFQLAGDDHALGAHAAGELGAGLDGQVALDVDVALELAGDADVARAFDLALDGEVAGDQRFLGRDALRARRAGLAARVGAGGRRRLERRQVGIERSRVLLGRGFLVEDRHVSCPLAGLVVRANEPSTAPRAPYCDATYIRNTPNRVPSRPGPLSIGAFRDAEIPRPSTRRVSAGSMMPSSHRRAVAYHGLPWVSYCSRTGALNASSSSALHCPPRASMPSRLTVASTLAACSPPITLMRAFGHIHRKRPP